jgi:hypothetical protein
MDCKIYFMGTMDKVPVTNKGIVIAWAKVDPEDLDRCLEFNWRLHSGGYAYRAKRRRGTTSEQIRLHRFVMNAPKGTYVDHIHFDQLDDRKSELRLCTNGQNMCNRKGLNKNSTSGAVGVSRRERDKKWRVYINVNRKQKWLGQFTNIEDAIAARDEAAKRLHGEFARLNSDIRRSVPDAA